MSNNTDLKAAFEESMNVMKDSVSAMLWKEAGGKILSILHHDVSLSNDLLTTGAMMTAAAYTDKNSLHGKLARDISIGMGLSTLDRLFSSSREVIASITDPLLKDVEKAKQAAEMNLLFSEGGESLEQAMSGNIRFSKETTSSNKESIELPAATVTPRNAVVISKPGPVPEKGAVESKASSGRPTCPKCGKTMKASKINKLVKLDDNTPEELKKFNGQKVCQGCYSEITSTIRASKADAEAKAKREKELLEARDNLVKTNESLKVEEDKLKSLAKAHEAVKNISPDVAKDTEAKMEECRKCVQVLSEQRDRLQKTLSA